MQITKRTTFNAGAYIASGKKKKINLSNRRKRYPTLITKIKAPATNILTTRFKAIRNETVNPLFSNYSYDYLYASAKNYAQLEGFKFNYKGDKEDIISLQEYFQSLLPLGYKVRLIDNKSYDHYIFQVEIRQDRDMLLYVPCHKIHSYDGLFKEILINFFQYLSMTQKLSGYKDSDDFYNFESMAECYCEEDKDNPGYKQFSRYLVGGDIYELFLKIEKHPEWNLTTFENKITEFKPTDGIQELLIPLIKKGIEFFKTGKRLFDYTAPPECYDLDCGSPVYPDELFKIIYDEDIAYEETLERVNYTAGDFGTYHFLSGKLLLTPDTKEICGEDGFADEFYKWIDDICEWLW